MNAIKLVDVNDNPISAQVAYDAAMSGLVYIAMNPEDTPVLITPISFMFKKSGEEIVTVVFSCYVGGSSTSQFYAGADPTGGVS